MLALILLLPACTRQPQPARIEEITFQSGEFTLVGDLRLPAGKARFPLVIFVHGSGLNDRTASGGYCHHESACSRPAMHLLLG